jgi:hypothetical protein
MKKIFFLINVLLIISISNLVLPNDILNEKLPAVKTNSQCPDDKLTSNEELVLQYLKSIQDNFSSNGWLVPAMEDNSGQTFNNALTAMAFILSGEQERAERILNFYAIRIDSTNQVINKQNFFYNYEARGFFQNIDLNSFTPFICDRWMGDNVWLLLAYKFYEQEYGFASKPLYSLVTDNLKNLLLEFYIDDPSGHGGFVRHGWRWGPRESSTPQNDYQLHEFDNLGNPVGHEEGNIDAYAAFKLLGLDEKAAKVKEWVDYRMAVLEGASGLPLDLYSWRALAFCNDGLFYKLLVNIPENDFGFKKVVNFNGKLVVGFFSRDDHTVNNVWLDGTGHMACAFYSSGFSDNGDYYSSQLDSFLIFKTINGINSLALPFTANKTGGYDWVDITKGFSSACAWYIFAKHRFNPFTLETYPPTEIEVEEPIKLNYKLEQNYPNPFNPTTSIQYAISSRQFVQLRVYDVLGNEIATLANEEKSAGTYEVEFNPLSISHLTSSGVYFYQLKAGDFVSTKKMLFLK